MFTAVSDNSSVEVSIGLEVDLKAVLPVATPKIEVLIDLLLGTFQGKFPVSSEFSIVVFDCIALSLRVLCESAPP